MAENKRAVGSVTYRDAEHGYFEKRKLRRHAAFWSLWALGVGAVISGDFYGWNVGLDAGGFGGLLVAGIIITVMYYGLCYSIAEMSPALPHTGGAYSFSRSTMGPWGGFVTGLAENMEYVITPAVVVSAMGFLSHDIVYEVVAADGWWNSPVLWAAIFYVIFVGINIIGIEVTMRFTVAITIAALGILAFFYVAVLVSRSFDAGLLTNIPPEEGGSSFFPKGWIGIFPALPFAIWFYLAIEELPLAAEESHDPKRDIPRATIWGLTTLVLFAVLTLFLNTGVGGGAESIGTSATPLFDGFKAVFGEGTGAVILATIGLIGLIASFFTIIYAYGRNTYSLSRAGYFPQVLSITHPKRNTPYVALIAGAVVGFLLVWLMYLLGQSENALAGKIVGALLYMAVFGAVISYFMQCLAFIMLRRKLPNIERPYRSPLGVPGAAIAGAIALVALVSLFFNADYRPGVVGTLVYFVVGLVYFAVVGRHKLVLSPEEEFALSQGQYGVNLEQEGYGAMSATQIKTDESSTRSP
jgi:ethanolamine permease